LVTGWVWSREPHSPGLHRHGLKIVTVRPDLHDFLIHITARDTEHIRQFVLDHLSSNQAVAGTQTSLVFEHTKGTVSV
jgi:hypothetical protein